MNYRLINGLTAFFTLATVGLTLLFFDTVKAESPMQDEEFSVMRQRQDMVMQIGLQAQFNREQTGIGAIDQRVLDAFRRVPRHHFVPPHLSEIAYRSHPLPLMADQNLTAPYIAALMTHLLRIVPGDQVFETGTDSGYQAAILSELGASVYSVEIVEPLHRVAARLLPSLGYEDIHLALGDGYYGWADDRVMFDSILIKEATADIPVPLLNRLKPGGRMVLPLGPPSGQKITVLVKHEDGSFDLFPVMDVTFSPFQGGQRI